MRRASLALVVVSLWLSACSDLRDFKTSWHGPRVGDNPILLAGGSATATATLSIDTIDTHVMTGTLAVDGLIGPTPFGTIAGAEADVLADLTFDGSPLRVYLAFVPMLDGGNDALAVISLYDDHRIELRVLRGTISAAQVYGIFSLTEGS